jgi:hypothetical protein
MRELIKIVGIILLGLFALVIGLPLLLTAIGIVLSGVGLAVGLAILLIKVAVVGAIIYLVLVGIRTILR